MANFCTQCGTQLQPGSAFCPSCGARVGAASAAPGNQPAYNPNPANNQQAYPQAEYQQPVHPQYVQNRAPVYTSAPGTRYGIPAPGFSDRLNDPEIHSMIKKNKKSSLKYAFIIFPIPIIIAAIIASVKGSDMGEAITGGLFVSAVMFILTVISVIKQSTQKTYDAVVIDKYHKTGDEDEDSEDVTVVRTDAGKKIELKDSTSWDYLPMGTRFRYHPWAAFPYELYDKTRETVLFCPACRTKNPIEEDRCKKCGAPMLK